MKFDECVFCERELEEYGYGCTEENGERAEAANGDGLKICKRCARRLKGILDAIQESHE